MAEAHIDGRLARLAEAVAAAARLLANARLPVVAGLGADVAGVRAAIRLARQLRGAFDHMAADAVLAGLSAMRDSGWMIVSPAELKRRADVVLVVGEVSREAWDQVKALLPEPGSGVRLIVIGQRRLARSAVAAGYATDAVEAPAATLPGLVAALRARVAGRTIAAAALARRLDAIAGKLKAARFGVALWSPESLGRLPTEMLSGLVKDLNATSRFSALPLAAGDNGWGATQVAAWLTGYPMRTGFGRGGPDHDPWRFEACRLIDSGEADAALWVSAYRPQTPPWSSRVPLIALTAKGANFAIPPAVQVEIGTPGIDHDAVEHRLGTGGLGVVTATRPSSAPTAAAVISAILAAIGTEPKR